MLYFKSEVAFSWAAISKFRLCPEVITTSMTGASSPAARMGIVYKRTRIRHHRATLPRHQSPASQALQCPSPTRRTMGASSPPTQSQGMSSSSLRPEAETCRTWKLSVSLPSGQSPRKPLGPPSFGASGKFTDCRHPAHVEVFPCPIP